MGLALLPSGALCVQTLGSRGPCRGLDGPHRMHQTDFWASWPQWGHGQVRRPVWLPSPSANCGPSATTCGSCPEGQGVGHFEIKFTFSLLVTCVVGTHNYPDALWPDPSEKLRSSVQPHQQLKVCLWLQPHQHQAVSPTCLPSRALSPDLPDRCTT